MIATYQSAIDQVWQFCREHREDAWNVPREGGRFLYMTAVAIGARRMLEIGTSYGFSGLHLAAAARDNGGRLVTIEKSRRKFEIAGDHFRRAGLDDVIESRQGSAEEVLATLDGPFDLVFVDAVKGDSLDYYRAFSEKLADRAVILTDNVTTHAESAFGGYLPALREDPRMVSLVVPIGNGFEYTLKTG